MSTDELKELKELKARLGLLDETEAAALQNMELPSLRNQRARGMGPPYTRIGRKVFYPIDKLRAHLAAATVTPRRSSTMVDGSVKRRPRRAEVGS